MTRLICLATQNQKKASELRSLLAPLSYQVKTLGDLGIEDAPTEDGDTFMENARIKADAAVRATGLPCIADDSGLCVDALDGAPGIFSARFGNLASDGERNAHLLRLMEGVSNRKARFVCASAFRTPGGTVIETEGVCHGEILTEPRGSNGFGYDPLFHIPGAGKTTAELTPAEKDAISHRGQALRQFIRRLAELQEQGLLLDSSEQISDIR